MNAKRAGRKAARKPAPSSQARMLGSREGGQRDVRPQGQGPQRAPPGQLHCRDDREGPAWEPTPESGLENSLLAPSGNDVTLHPRNPLGCPREKILGIIFGAS